VVKLPKLQLALDCPLPSTDAATHFKLTADCGTVVQPMKLDEPVPTIKVQVCPFLPCVIFQVMVATVPAAIVLPGLFAVNGTELGVALIWVTALNPPDEVFGLADGEAGMGWRLLAAGF
jgi:hypothetical protein